MNYNLVKQFIDQLPQSIPPFLLSIVLVGIITLLKDFIIPLAKIKRKEIINKQNDQELLLSDLKSFNVYDIRNAMIKQKDKCYSKGYRDNNDNKRIGELYHFYKKFNGNTDGEIIYRDFINLPYKATTQIPLEIGHSLPETENMNLIIKMIKHFNNDLINEDELESFKKLIKE